MSQTSSQLSVALYRVPTKDKRLDFAFVLVSKKAKHLSLVTRDQEQDAFNKISKFWLTLTINFARMIC